MQLIKFCLTLFMLMVFFLGGVFLYLLPIEFWKKQSLKTRWIQWCCKIGLKIMQVRTHIDAESLPVSSFIVCNHMSYLDVLILTQLAPMSFVTSQEIKETPVLGWLCQVGGCLFVERRNKSNIHKEIEQITLSLKNQQNVVVFPEATSTNAEQVLRFKRPLYNAAIFSEKPVSVLCLNYTHVSGERFSLANRDRVCWYGDMSFLPHLWNFMSLKSIQAKVKLCAVLSSQGQSAEQLAERSHHEVLSQFIPIEKGVSYADSSTAHSHWAKA